MADDCPHRKQLENTLRACHDQTAVMAATRENYLNIIDELKHDLDELTLEVAQQQQQQCNLENSFENELPTTTTSLPGTKESLAMPPATTAVPAFGLEHAMYALAAQNERLQQALLDKCNSADMTRIHTLEKHNTELTCHIQHLTSELNARDSHITHLNSTINGQSAYCERIKLQEEINSTREELSESKQKICDLSRSLREATSMLQAQRNDHLDMCRKYEKLQCIYDEQGNQLKAACLKMQSIQDCFKDLEKRQDELKMERNILRDEVMGLKEKEACLLGREKSLIERLKIADNEILKARNLACEMQTMMQREDESHKNSIMCLQAANEEYKRKLCDFSIECKNMQADLKQQVAINDQREKIIESYKKWQADQIKSDEITRKTIRGAEKHVQLLLEQNQQLMEDNQTLIFDSDTLSRELQRLRQCITTFSVPRQSGGSDVTVEEAMASRLRFLRDTTRRLAAHQRTLASAAMPDKVEDEEAETYRDTDNSEDNVNERGSTES